MAITNFTAYKAALTSPKEVVPISVAVGSSATRLMDLWMGMTPVPSAAPTTAVAPTSASSGAPLFQNSTTGTLGLAGASIRGVQPGMYLLIDRLSHQGGLSGTVTGSVTTNLPTAALTRYTDGAGVMMAATTYTQVGTTATTLTVTYTNSAGTGSRVSPLVVFGGTGFREANRFLPLPLAADDVGVRSIQSSTIAVTTGTAGAFGLTLFKPLAVLIIDNLGSCVVACDLVTGNMGGGLPEIVDSACLSFVGMFPTASGCNASGSLFLTEW